MTMALKYKTIERCVFCDGVLRKKYSKMSDRLETIKKLFTVWECENCGVGVTVPFVIGEAGALYPRNYLIKDGGSFMDRWYRYDQYRFDFSFLPKHIENFKLYLDIGCGSGDRVEFVRTGGCKKSFGIDKFDNIGEKKSNIINSEITDYKPVTKFEVVSLFHVLEHLENPERILKYIRDNILERNGFLIIQVPNYGSWERKIFGRKWFGLDAPRHLWHFSENNLKRVIENVGFKPIKVIKRNAWLHPVTIVPSLFPELDVQRIWIKHDGLKAVLLMFMWTIMTVLTIPISIVASIFSQGSMLTVVAVNTKDDITLIT